MRDIPRIARLARLAVSEFRGDRLAHDEAAEGLETPHHQGRLRRRVRGEDARAVARRDATRGDDVLHADRDSEERQVAEDAPGALLRLGHGARGVEPFPRLDARLERDDASRTGGYVVLNPGPAFAAGAQRL